MKALYHFRTQGTGAEGVHIAGMAQALESLGHEVIFSSPTGIDPRRSAGRNPFQGPRQRGWLSRLAAQAPPLVFELLEIAYNVIAWGRNRRLLAAEHCDFIYERHAFFLCATAQLAQRRRLPLIIEVNELVGDERVRPEPTLSALARWTDAYAFRRAALIVVVSPHLQRRIVAMGVAPERVLVLPNAVAQETLARQAQPTAVRNRYHCAQAVVVGFVGWFVPWHRLEWFLEQFAEVAATRPQLRLLLVGEGNLRPQLAALAERLQIADRVIFTGAVPHSEIPDHIAAMDICVVPHSNEYRSPIKLFEYMASARAVLAPRTEPIATVLRDGINGRLFEAGDAAQVRAGLGALADDARLRERLGEQARRDIETRHTWQHNAEAVLGALRESVAKPESA